MHESRTNRTRVFGRTCLRRWCELAVVVAMLSAVASTPARSDAAQNKVSNVTFANDGQWLEVNIESTGSWAHWTLGNPPRIIVDISDAVSELPEAPGLYEKALTSGPVRRFRTSQFSNTSLDRRVRMTLELSEAKSYEAKRVGQNIVIRIKDNSPAGALFAVKGTPVPSSPNRAIKSNESSTSQDEADSLAEEFVDISKLRALLASSIEKNSAPDDEPSEPAAKKTKKPEAAKPTVPKPKPTAAVEKPKPASKPNVPRPSPTVTPKTAPPQDAAPTLPEPDLAATKSDMQARIAAALTKIDEEPTDEANDSDRPTETNPDGGRLSNALAAVFEPVSDPAPVPRLPRPGESPDDALDESNPPTAAVEAEDDLAAVETDSDERDETQKEPALAELPAASDEDTPDEDTPSAPPEDPAKDDLAAADRNEDERVEDAKSRLEDLLGPGGELGEPSPDAPAEIDVPPVASIDQLPEDWDDSDEVEDEVFDPTEMHAVRAAGLLIGAVSDWVRGDLEGAYARADRIHRYYPGSPAGEQAGLLVAEIHHLRGDDAMAAAVTPIAAAPNPEMLPLEFFSRLLENLWVHERFEHLATRLEQWNKLYPRHEWFADFHYRLGTRSYRLRDQELAERHLVLVPEGNAREPKSLLMRARLFDEADSTEAALRLYEQLARLEPHGYAQRGLSRSADLHFQLDHIPEALRLYEKVRSRHPTSDEDAWALYQIGNCQIQLGDDASAQEAYTELVKNNPNSYWFEFAEERLRSLEWSGDMARRIEELSQP